MGDNRDDWEKPRSKGTHLTPSEIDFIREGFCAFRLHRDVARDLKCSSRIVCKYYGFFEAQGVRRGKRTINLRLPSRDEGSIIAPPSKAKLMGGR